MAFAFVNFAALLISDVSVPAQYRLVESGALFS